MHLPFIVLSYDMFERSKKIFSYERDGVHTLPIFTDPAIATKFADRMEEALQKLGDRRTLHAQICADPKHALNIFETITAYFPDLLRVAVDPAPITREDTIDDASDYPVFEDVRDIGDVLESIRDLVSISKTPKPSSHS